MLRGGHPDPEAGLSPFQSRIHGRRGSRGRSGALFWFILVVGVLFMLFGRSGSGCLWSAALPCRFRCPHELARRTHVAAGEPERRHGDSWHACGVSRSETGPPSTFRWVCVRAVSRRLRSHFQSLHEEQLGTCDSRLRDLGLDFGECCHVCVARIWVLGCEGGGGG